MVGDAGGAPPKVTVQADRELCIGAGECSRLLPQTFGFDDDGFVALLDTENTTVELLRRAENACPSGAITVVEG